MKIDKLLPVCFILLLIPTINFFIPKRIEASQSPAGVPNIEAPKIKKYKGPNSMIGRLTARKVPPKPKSYYPVGLPIGCSSVRNILLGLGVKGSELSYALIVINKESSCNQFAINKSSGAYGLPQSLPGSKMATHGADWRTNPVTQLRWFKDYVRQRYGSMYNAHAFQIRNGWY